MNGTILILGAGVMQLPPIRAAKRLGLHVIVADGNRDAVGIAEADGFLPVDLKDHESMAEAAQEIRRRRGLDAVFTAGTDFSATVAFVAGRVGLPGTRYEAALDATDKFRMRRVLRAAGVRVPDFAVVTGDELERRGLSSVESTVSLPVVVKPVDSMGARGVVRADSWDDAAHFAREAAVYSRSGRVVVERYIDGPEFSLDAIVFGDDVQITGFADRHICFPPYFVEMGHTIPTVLCESDRRLVIDEFVQAVRALSIGPGAAKGDVKLSSDGAVIGEVAARLSGGYMSGWTYPLSSGVPLSEIAIRVALGQTPPRAKPLFNRTTAERAVISIPGRLREIAGLDAARCVGGVEEIFVSASPGQTVRFPRNNVEKLGSVIAVADTRIDAVAAAEEAVRRVVPVLEPRSALTDEFLFGNPGESTAPEHLHRAFESPLVPDVVRPDWSNVERSVGAGRPHVSVPRSLRDQHARDWAHRTLCESIDIAAAVSQCVVLEVDSFDAVRDPLSLLFLAAVQKGGLQGGRYVLESCRRLDYTAGP